MQIWPTTRSVARDELHESEVSQSLMSCFDNASPEKYSFVVDLFCFISLCLRVAVFLPMRRERIEIFHRSPLRENSGSMQFLDTKKRSSRSPRDTPRGMFQDRRPQKNCLNDELMWCLVVFQYDFHGQQLSHQVKEKLFLKDILCLKAGSYLRSRPLARNRTKQILPCNNQANELWLPRRWNQWKHWAKCQRLGAKCDRLDIFKDLRTWT